MRFFLLIILLFSNIVYSADNELIQKHQNWDSRIVSDNTQVRFRSLTQFVEHGDIVIFTIDRLPSDCNLQYLGMNILTDEVAQKSFITDNLFGQMRIDEYPTHDIAYTLQFIEGNKPFFLTVTNFNREYELIPELEKGQTVRFKLKTDNKEIFLRFNLTGFKEASSRSLNLCNAFNQTNDKRYFDKEPKTNKKNKNRKDDASYF